MAAEGRLRAVHSYVHSTGGKVTSLTVSVPKTGKYCIVSFSDKKNIIRVKLNLDEIAGLAKAVEGDVQWNCFHTFQRQSQQSETRIHYNNGFINAEKAGVKIALKLGDDERASLQMVLKTIFTRMI